MDKHNASRKRPLDDYECNKPGPYRIQDCINERNNFELPTNMILLAGENFVSVCNFLGHTRVHIRRFVSDEEGNLQPTKDGVSLSPNVWYSLCLELKTILNHKSSEKVFIVERDLCISKQFKDGAQVFVLQRMFQRKNFSMQFVPECVVLREPELGKLYDNMKVITDMVKEGLITYSLSYYVTKEIQRSRQHLKPKDNPDGLLELLESLEKCLCVIITIKITELINCFGCREDHTPNFMHDCVSKSRLEKWSEYFDRALYQIDMNSLARDLVQKNLNIDFDTVLGVEEFFNVIKVQEIFKSVEKMYVGDEENIFNNDSLITSWS